MNCTIPDIMHVVACEFNLTVNDLKQRTRETRIAGPRQIVAWIARDVTKLSLTQIGDRLGGFDHTTILHNVRVIEERMRGDVQFAATVRRLAHAAVVRTAHRINNIQTQTSEAATA